MMNLIDNVDLGVVYQLLKFDDVTDVSLKNGGEIWVTSNIKGHYLHDATTCEAEILRIASQLACKMQKDFNPSFPSLEGDLQSDEDDYRFGCVHPYLSPSGCVIVFRKVRKKLFLTFKKLVEENSISKEALNLLILAVKSKLNMIFIGTTGSGKTELLKYLSQFIPEDEVVVTIEDSLEFNLKKLVPKISVSEFRIKESISYRDVISMSLRLNVQRILLQEARGEEVSDLLDAMSTGHTVLTTMHASKIEQLPLRILQMLKLVDLSYSSIEKRVYQLIDIVIKMKSFKSDDGIKRVVEEIAYFEYCINEKKCIYHTLYLHNQSVEKIPKTLMAHLKGYNHV
ncbi:MAG: ATPase, T2SS/T4P/T4SS family [Anaerorhabdus sp.]